MSVRFVIGRSGTGKTRFINNEIRTKLMDEPNGSPIIYLVPDQMTFLSEYSLIKTPGLGGMIRAQVFSFSRLAWRILQETGGINRMHITNEGLNMLIRKIIEDKKDELRLFGRAADKTGFIHHVEMMLTEFKRYCIHPEDIIGKQGEMENNGSKVLADKLHDLELIYCDFEEKLANKYLDSEDYLTLLAESIQSSFYLQNAQIYIDGFHSFTPQEYLVVGQLMKVCKQVTIALTLDQPFRNEISNDLHLFRMSSETYLTLSELAYAHGVEIEDNIVLKKLIRYTDDSLMHLEENFDNLPVKPYDHQPQVQLFQAVNRRAEMEAAAREIRELVRINKFRYQDIAILVRNGHEYQEMLETCFSDHQIPYFIDQKRTMLNHPLIELIRSTLEVITGFWRYESVFRAVKTDLLFPLTQSTEKLREKMDLLENYVLAYGIQGSKWTSKDRWIYRRFRGLEMEHSRQTDKEKEMEQEINNLRSLITTPIIKLSKRMNKGVNGRDFCEALYLFLEELDIPAKLESLRNQAEDHGNLLSAREHDQAWNAVIELLDQFVEILGDETITVKKFASILDAGIEAMKFSIVPPAVDQVLVANLELSRLSDVKVAFIIGLNDGVMPAKINEEGVLADSDREMLITNGMKIAPSSKTRLLDEEFIAYKAFTTPSQKLYLSYPIANEEGKALLPSPYIKRMKEIFPEMIEKMIVNDPSELIDKEQIDYISHPNSAIAFLTSQLQLKLRKYPVADIWWDVYNFYFENLQQKKRAKHVLSSLFYENRAKKLSAETSKELYGETILASVSRMELFHSCPFAHFSTHGLKLHERDIFKLEAPAIGDLFHGALKWIAENLQKNGISWSNLTKEQCNLLAKEAVAYLSPRLQHQILLSSNRYHYIKRKLEQVIGRASIILSEHAKVSGFAPIGLELGFGPKAFLPPLSFTLKNGVKMELQGRIDRVDKAQDQNGVYLRIIDYKSSQRELDLTEVYYGLALQMLTYLDIVVTHSKNLIGTEGLPAGVLYFHLHNPIIKSNRILTMDEIDDEIFKRFKMKGLLMEDTDVIKLMDQTLETGSSKIVSAEIKKDGSLSSRSQVASEKDFSLMSHYVRNRYKKSGNDITSGIVDISPYKLKKKTPCEYCSFKSVCQFDQSLENNDYRLLTPSKPEDILSRMREEVGINENIDTI
ncbi:helicase-exonuclease AddAB subunit AddB [Heyndrickxia vini]|uniref:ATP-dependent helicase/deoxyribonuclease subunit B n=1 Tax=Heyndrickxia vini TaxID=1476025 RepID=A0ABX7E0E9_9BACI|nr:helicase-exonuclease AddAB subunit AddB [Heyndrickxia vini]QQZ08262.1 helicase-exonuclease AddAB subunit AddB [Heyndrickxia vini]